jgi:nitroreductase
VSGLRDAVAARRSFSRVTDAAPSHEELLPLVEAASRAADHASLHPWRLIELRGDDRRGLGAAIARAEGKKDDEAERVAAKPLRAPLLIAVVAVHRPSEKVPRWEQTVAAAGVAHALSLLLDDAGWGVIWRTGHYTRSRQVAKFHRLSSDERLLGWLYVGGKPDGSDSGPRKNAVDPAEYLTSL